VCWRTEYEPEEWNIAVVTPIHKKESRNDCSNYRSISLLNSCYKTCSKILNNRTSKIAENIILDNQHGLRKEHSCTDCIFVLTQLIEKSKEYNNPIFLGFVDYEKAFDRMNRNKL
jgi:sorting nexin-29